MSPGEIIFSGDLLLALPLALAAGALSALSPCVLPLIPAYLGFVAGSDDPSQPRSRLRLMGSVGLFVLGFSLVFIAFNTFSGAAGQLLLGHQDVIIRVSGVLVILMGLVFIGFGRFLQRQLKIPLTGERGKRIVNSRVAPLVLGLVFAVGWTPCLGPTLVAVNALSLSGSTSSAWRGLMLGVVYCVGLGIPFVILALGFGWATKSFAFLKRHIRLINLVGGLLLILVGLAMVLGLWQAVVGFLQQWVITDYHVPI